MLTELNSEKHIQAVCETPRKVSQNSREDKQKTHKKNIGIEVPCEEPVKRVKSMTRITERQSINVVYVLLVLLWAFFGAGILLLSFWSKMTHAGFDAKQEIENCQRDYAQNNCDNAVKGARKYCEQKKTCSSESLQAAVQRRTSLMKIAGELAHEFSNAAGAVNLLVGLALFWLCSRGQGKSREIISMEYYE